MVLKPPCERTVEQRLLDAPAAETGLWPAYNVVSKPTSFRDRVRHGMRKAPSRPWEGATSVMPGSIPPLNRGDPGARPGGKVGTARQRCQGDTQSSFRLLRLT